MVLRGVDQIQGGGLELGQGGLVCLYKEGRKLSVESLLVLVRPGATVCALNCLLETVP